METSRKLLLVVVPILLAALVSGCGEGTLEVDETPIVEDETRTISEELTASSAGALIRATANVNLRSGPSTSKAILAVVAAGGLATVVSGAPQNGFFNIRYGSQTGWSHGGYWEALPKISSTDAVNVRSGPGTGFAILVTAPAGATAWKLGEGSNGFWYIHYAGTNGYSSSQFWKTAGTSTTGLFVNGRRLTALEDKWVRYIAKNVVPNLAGTRANRIEKAARVTWWSLKEGVLDLTNPLAYSNCNTSSGDVRLSPLGVCASGRAWQVGIGAVQVPGKTLSDVQARALALYPGWNIGDVLWKAATDAGFSPGSAEYNGILNSTGSLRLSWLLRNGAVGFSYEEPVVTHECINNSFGWCYGTGWDTTSWYAPNKTAALRSISDLNGILSTLAP